MKITTWNINGVKARLESALTYLRQAAPDIVCLQEIKSVDEGFPSAAFEELGYNLAVHGQKGFNGVAILSKLPLRRGEPRAARRRRRRAGALHRGDRLGAHGRAQGRLDLRAQRQSHRHGEVLLQARLDGAAAGAHPRLARRGGAPRHRRRLQRHPRARGRQAPRGLDRGRAVPAGKPRGLSLPRQSTASPTRCGSCHPEPGIYTFWDYQAGALQKNDGIRIDHLLLSPQAADRLKAAGVDRFTRGWEKPSDHVPVWIDLDL